jgi:hypothetical protein
VKTTDRATDDRGSDWALLPTRTRENLRAVWGSSSSDVFAVGNDGIILHFPSEKLAAAMAFERYRAELNAAIESEKSAIVQMIDKVTNENGDNKSRLFSSAARSK